MKNNSKTFSRRIFLGNATISGAGLILGFNWLSSCKSGNTPQVNPAENWYEINGYLKVGDNGVVTIYSPNPEGGQNVKTSMPMLVAEELDVNWDNVIIEQAPLDTEKYTRQFIGGSQAIRRSWEPLRIAGATARYMLLSAAATQWQVPREEITTEDGILYHKKSGKSAHYGTMAAAAAQEDIPESVPLKEIEDFKIIGTSRKNVDGKDIVTGKPLFGIDTYHEGMLIAMVVHPPAFGLTLKSIDDVEAKAMPGIHDIFKIKTFNDDYEWHYFDTNTFTDLVAIVGDSTWEVMQARKVLKIEWEPFEEYEATQNRFGTISHRKFPAGMENSQDHLSAMKSVPDQQVNVQRKDGDPERIFKTAATVIERTYTAPFLAHNCMEPMNFFADVRSDKAFLKGPLQKPEYTEQTLSARLGIPLENIEIEMTRLGGGFGRRSYAHWLVEAALISQRVNAPVKLMYTREDDMTSGIYRPTYLATYRAALDDANNLVAFHVRAGGIPESPLAANRFPAGAVDHYLAEEWILDSNITTGSFRAPRSNFIAAAEQSFLDEIAEAIGKDPIQFRLDLLDRASENPVGENNDYDAKRLAGVLELVRDKSGWSTDSDKNRGVSAYFCHNSYAAHVLDVEVINGVPVVDRVCTAIDCGIVINPDAARNMSEGAIVDGIGCAMYGAVTFQDGKTQQKNFDRYRQIRHSEAPKSIDVHFVENTIDPTGMGEPAFPPVFGALANALYQATGKRHYDQPFISEEKVAG